MLRSSTIFPPQGRHSGRQAFAFMFIILATTGSWPNLFVPSLPAALTALTRWSERVGKIAFHPEPTSPRKAPSGQGRAYSTPLPSSGRLAGAHTSRALSALEGGRLF